MNVELLSVERLCFCAFEIFMLCSFFQSMFQRRVGKKKFAAYFMAMTVFVFLENSFGNTVLNLLLIPFMCILFSVMAFRISFRCGVVYSLIYYIVFSGGREVVFELLYRQLFMMLPIDIEVWLTPYGTPYLIAEYFLSFLFLLFTERFTRRLKVNEDGKFCWYLLIMPAASLVILISYVYMEFPKSGFIAAFVSAGAVLLYLSNIAVFIILGKFTEVMDHIKLKQMSDLKKSMEKTNYESVDKMNAVYRKHLHDMHQYFNQFGNLAARGENQAIVKIVEEMEGRLRTEQNNILYSRDPVLNGLLVEYCGRAKEKGVKMAVFVEDNLFLDFLSDSDKISLFGNLLSNAAEASEKCGEGERHINVEIYMGNMHFLVFRVENTYKVEPYRENGSFLTTKEDMFSHGLGIKIVEELAEKYGGALEMTWDGERFVSMLMLSSYEEKEKKEA